MVTNGLIELVLVVVNFMNALLPSLTPPSWAHGDPLGSTLASGLGGLLSIVAPIFPVDAVLSVLAAIVTMLPVLLGIVVFQWIWDHLPMIAGNKV